MQTKQLYQDCSSRLVALIDPSEHTMGEEAFGHYVNGKFTDHQRRILRQALDGGWPIDVHGVYRNHVAEFQHDRSFRPIDTALARPRHKLFNVHRPSMNIVEDSNGVPIKTGTYSYTRTAWNTGRLQLAFDQPTLADRHLGLADRAAPRDVHRDAAEEVQALALRLLEGLP